MAVPPLQLAPRHSAVGYEQLSPCAPSQVPPQAVPSVAQDWRAPWGSPLTAVQAPTLPGTSQAWHWPSQA